MNKNYFFFRSDSSFILRNASSRVVGRACSRISFHTSSRSLPLNGLKSFLFCLTSINGLITRFKDTQEKICTAYRSIVLHIVRNTTLSHANQLSFLFRLVCFLNFECFFKYAKSFFSGNGTGNFPKVLPYLIRILIRKRIYEIRRKFRRFRCRHNFVIKSDSKSSYFLTFKLCYLLKRQNSSISSFLEGMRASRKMILSPIREKAIFTGFVFNVNPIAAIIGYLSLLITSNWESKSSKTSTNSLLERIPTLCKRPALSCEKSYSKSISINKNIKSPEVRSPWDSEIQIRCDYLFTNQNIFSIPDRILNFDLNIDIFKITYQYIRFIKQDL